MITDDLANVPEGFRGVYEARVAGLKAALRAERRWQKTMRKMVEFHPELQPIIREVDHFLKTNPQLER